MAHSETVSAQADAQEKTTVTVTPNFTWSTETPQEFPIRLNPDKYAYITQRAGEVVLTNLASPLGRPEKVRVAIENIADVYKGTDISPAFETQNKSGKSLVLQVTNSFTKTYTDGVSSCCCGDNEQVLPLATHIVWKYPDDADVTVDMLQEELERLISTLDRPNSSGNVDIKTTLASLMRGGVSAIDRSDIKFS